MSALDSNKMPLAVFTVVRGYKYRFRIIAGTCLSCVYRILIANHKFAVMTTDDSNIKPVNDCGAADMAAGERADIMMHANQTTSSVHWIVVKGLGACAGINQVAILKYNGSTEASPTQSEYDALVNSTPAFIYNELGSPCNKSSLNSNICISQASSYEQNPPEISMEPYKTFFFLFGFFTLNATEFFTKNEYHSYFSPAPGFLLSSHINNVSHVPNSAPVLTQYNDIPSSEFCSRKLCSNHSQLCECSHLIKVPHKKLIWIIFIDTSNFGLSHPFHLHGHDFWIIEEGLLSNKNISEIQKSFNDPNIYKNISKYLPSKDVIRVPPNGYAAVAVYFDNRGVWLLHCHFAYHQKNGMEALIQVGEYDDFLSPPRGFPKCHNFEPPILNLSYFNDEECD